MNTKIQLRPYLQSFFQELIDLNGFEPDQYVNDLLEKGIRRDLEESYTPDSVSKFMVQLTTKHQAEWCLLQPVGSQ